MASQPEYLRNLTRSKWDEFHTQDDLRITSYELLIFFSSKILSQDTYNQYFRLIFFFRHS